jgi:hypothetical protein
VSAVKKLHPYDFTFDEFPWLSELDSSLREVVKKALLMRVSAIHADGDPDLIASGTASLEQVEARRVRGEEALRAATGALREFDEAWRGMPAASMAPAPKPIFGDPREEEWDDEARAALDQLALDVVEMYADSRRGLPATFDDVWVSLWPYSTTTRKNDRDRIVIHFDDDQESRDEVLESLARLVAAGHVEMVGPRYVITAEGRRHLRALQES